ncbi:MAG: membrane dipeptidase [Eggerthellales bacterium]|nr:membrane dipeptidase [Eggerthellales bacterium]
MRDHVDLSAPILHPAQPSARVQVFDLHCDTLDRLALHDSFPEASFVEHDAHIPAERLMSLYDNDADVDLARMSDYDLAQCFAIFVPDRIAPDSSWECFGKVLSFFNHQMEAHASRVEQIRDCRSVQDAFARGHAAAILTVEGASFMTSGLERLMTCVDAGVKMITLTWNGPNAIASGNQTTNGLSSYGRIVVSAMEAHKVVVDVSHLNDQSFWDVMEATSRPVAASHSNLRSVCGHPRNLTDEMFRAIVERGGVVGLNYCPYFLVDEGTRDASPSDLLRHVDRMLSLGGERAVCLGSDYDGCDAPEWIRPASRVGWLHQLLTREFGADIADAICFGNAARFFADNEAI